MEHVFIDLEIAKPLKEYLKSLEGHSVEMEHIRKRNVFNFGKIGKNTLIENDTLKVASTCGIIFTVYEQCGYEIMMLISCLEMFD